jgi:thiamine transport system permease protein
MSLLQVVFVDWRGAWERLLSEWFIEALQFTLWQAFLSALISVFAGLVLAMLLAHRKGVLRRALLLLSALPFALPSVLVAFAFVLAYGRSGFVLPLLGAENTFLYTPAAVVVAHVFFNLPLAFRQSLETLESLPHEQLRASLVLNLSVFNRFRYAMLPQLAPVLASLFVFIFILCSSSFAVVLLLGGGPQATTLEVAVYQLLRLEADPAAAAVVALTQIILLLPLVFLYRKITGRAQRGRVFVSTGSQSSAWILEKSSLFRFSSLFFAALYAAFLGIPLVALVLDAAKGLSAESFLVLRRYFWEALWGSLSLALPSAFACVVLAWLFVRGLVLLRENCSRTVDVLSDGAWLLMGLSPTVLALGWIVALSGSSLDVYGNPYPAILLVHALLSLPLCVRLLLPPALVTHRQTERSCRVLGIEGWKRMLFVEWPEMRKPLVSAFLLAFAFSFGEVSAVLMFGSGGFTTLPSLIFELMGSYRYDAAALVSLVLAVVCVGFFGVAEFLFRGRRTVL